MVKEMICLWLVFTALHVVHSTVFSPSRPLLLRSVVLSMSMNNTVFMNLNGCCSICHIFVVICNNTHYFEREIQFTKCVAEVEIYPATGPGMLERAT